MKTKSQTVAADVAALLRARNPLLWIVTREEARVERYLIEAAAAAGYIPRTWDVAAGVCDLAGKRLPDIGGTDPGETLGAIASRTTERGVWIMRDMPAWLTGPGGIVTLRQVRNLARSLPGRPREQAQAIIVISPSGDVPAELSSHATVLEWPLPDREEIAAILDSAIDSLPDEMKASAAPNGSRDAAIDAAVGLAGDEAAATYAKSLVQLRRIDPAAVAQEKRRVISRGGMLEWFDPLPGGLAAVGGLENLKTWLTARSAAYSPAARAYGLPAPRGALLAGIPGCGKSLTAKAIATAWGVPLLRLDMNGLKSKFVGESEGNLRKAFRIIEAIGRCVVWVDEIEKALSGATQGAADGGVSSDALGTLLSWMQERQGQAFVIATANDVESLPPELLRKGRFDEIWWIDLPTRFERVAILKATLKAYGREVGEDELKAIAEATSDFTGSEIAAIVPDALFTAFADGGRDICMADLLAARDTVVPLAKTAAEKINRLRAWAQGRARPATKTETAATEAPARLRVLDM
jgi:MoxR-like ATPase